MMLILKRFKDEWGRLFILGSFVYFLLFGLANIDLFWFYTLIMPVLSLYSLFIYTSLRIDKKKIKDVLIGIFTGLGLFVYFVIIEKFPTESEKCFNLIAGYLSINITDADLIEQYCNEIQYENSLELLSKLLLVFIGIFIGHIIYQLKFYQNKNKT